MIPQSDLPAEYQNCHKHVSCSHQRIATIKCNYSREYQRTQHGPGNSVCVTQLRTTHRINTLARYRRWLQYVVLGTRQRYLEHACGGAASVASSLRSLFDEWRGQTGRSSVGHYRGTYTPHSRSVCALSHGTVTGAGRRRANPVHTATTEPHRAAPSRAEPSRAEPSGNHP